MSSSPDYSLSSRPFAVVDRTAGSRRWLARSRPAFTLVEMLAVMAVIAVILALTGPVVRGIMSGRNVSDGVDAINGYLAYARTQAVTQNTYVIVGFYQASGSDDLQMAGIVSANGTFNPGTFNPSSVISPAANFLLLGNTLHVSNVTLVPKASLSAQLQAKVPTTDTTTTVDCSTSPNYPPTASTNPASYYSFPFPAASFPLPNGSSCVIAFSPQGEALFFPNSVTNFSANLPFYSQLFIGLRATRGGSVVNGDVNSAAITLDGGSGDIKVYRL